MFPSITRYVHLGAALALGIAANKAIFSPLLVRPSSSRAYFSENSKPFPLRGVAVRYRLGEGPGDTLRCNLGPRNASNRHLYPATREQFFARTDLAKAKAATSPRRR